MPISNMQWCIEIGIFNATFKGRDFKKKSLRVAAPVFCFFSFGFHFVFILQILFVCDDVELNPGPKKQELLLQFLNLSLEFNSITTYNFAKVNLLQTYNVIHDFDVIWFV